MSLTAFGSSTCTSARCYFSSFEDTSLSSSENQDASISTIVRYTPAATLRARACQKRRSSCDTLKYRKPSSGFLRSISTQQSRAEKAGPYDQLACENAFR